MTDDELTYRVAEEVMGWRCEVDLIDGVTSWWVDDDDEWHGDTTAWSPLTNDVLMNEVLAKWADRVTRLYGNGTGWTACVSPATGCPDRMADSDGLTMQSLKRAILLAMLEACSCNKEVTR